MGNKKNMRKKLSRRKIRNLKIEIRTREIREIQHIEKKNHNFQCDNIKEEINAVFEPEEIEQTIGNGDGSNKNDDKFGCDVPCQTPSEEEIDAVFEREEIEETIDSGDGTKTNDEPGSDAPCQTPSNEELWLVRKQLCRGCHSDGAFWSLQTTTEGDTYEDLLKTYFNIQLCPVSADERALSAICTLCAARLRDARAFSAQARVAEEHFTRLYAQNRIRALTNGVVIKEDTSKIKVEVDDLEIAALNDVESETANSDFQTDDPVVSIGKLVPNLNKTKTQMSSDKPVFRLSPSDYEYVGNSYKCTRCNKFYYKRCNILKHVKNVHFKLHKYTWPHCDKTFDLECVGNRYKCIRCEKQFASISLVRKHIKYLHLKLPRYTCPHCKKPFYKMIPFTKHKLEEHSIDDRIKCNACDWFTYGYKSKLINHKNSFHMLGKKITCPDCDYVCFDSSALSKHLVKHSTVKNHTCKYCKKSFLRKNNLVIHEKIHTGDKRQVCNVCGQAFVQRASLKYHLEKYHPEVRL